MRLDHFVVHINNDPNILRSLKEKSDAAGLPFEPSRGKGTKGFKVANIWVGDEYLEIPWLKTTDGGGWQKEWVQKYNQGKRGLFCFFLEVNDLQKTQEELRARGINSEITYTSFRVLFGLYKVTMPWSYLYLPSVPGTDLQISFFQYGPGAKDKYRPYMKPNSKENGITGINNATVYLPDWENGVSFVKRLLPSIGDNNTELKISLSNGGIRFIKSRDGTARVRLEAESLNPNFIGKGFELENVELAIVEKTN